MACCWVGCATLTTFARECLSGGKFNSVRPWSSYSGRVGAYLETIRQGVVGCWQNSPRAYSDAYAVNRPGNLRPELRIADAASQVRYDFGTTEGEILGRKSPQATLSKSFVRFAFLVRRRALFPTELRGLS